MATLQVRIDDTLRLRAQEVASSMGLDLTQAVRLFLYQMVRVNGLPFRPEADPFYSEQNIRYLEKAAKEMDTRKKVCVHELIVD